MTDHQALVRPNIIEMDPYKPIVPFEVLSEQLGRPTEAIIKLDANETPYGPCPQAVDALTRIADEMPIYPDPQSRRLRERLAEYTGVDMAHILCGAGADELIDLTMRLFLGPGDAFVNCPPTFGMYTFDGGLVGAQEIVVDRCADFSLDIDAVEGTIRETGAKIIFIASPNNPDGGVVDHADLERLLALPLIVVMDEAYMEFSHAESVAQRVPATPNLIVLRTFSKWAGLAGLRIGYGIYPLWMMDHLWKIKQPYNVNVAADAAARASLDNLDLLLERVERIKAERDRLFTLLHTINYLTPTPSDANFILCDVSGIEAGELKRRLAEDHGILIRYYNKPRLENRIRVTVGKPAHTDALIAALRQIGEGL
ncbi:MAG: histidinol-phosphate transaminase [Chloroflexi bacterium]|nr:histidinol-phosphate transaminase [Chloroflexota bacterium]